MKKTTMYIKEHPGEYGNHAADAEELLLRIACELIRYRGEENLTQKQLADRAGLSHVMVCRLESGEYNPTVKLLFDISRKLGWKFKLEFGRKAE